METLAVIAYKQPITKAEIEEVRGVNSDKVIKQLLSRALIAELGHKDTVGRPILYGTTDEFLRSTGVTSIDDLHKELDTAESDMSGVSIDSVKDEKLNRHLLMRMEQRTYRKGYNMERLQKFIASCGVASRRKAEELIAVW